MVGSRYNLDWKRKNRRVWLTATSDGEVFHRILVHSIHGFIFLDHDNQSTPFLTVQALMERPEKLCPCQLLALWERKRLSWVSGIVSTEDREAPTLSVVLSQKEENALFFTIHGTLSDLMFLNQVLHAIEKDIFVRWFRF